MTDTVHVAYVMSRFPKLTETFVLYEMLALDELRFDVSIYPLLRHDEPVMHPEAAQMASKARYVPFVSRQVLASQIHHLRHRPRSYLSTLATLVRANLGSLNYLGGALAIFPKAAHIARLAVADRVDHVHCHFSSHPAVAGFIVHRLSGIPFSFTAHGSDLHVDRHMLCEKVAEAQFVVSVSAYNRRIILDHCTDTPADKVVVIHSGVDMTVFVPRSMKADVSSLAIVCIGRFIDVKGQSYLIEACRLLVQNGVTLICHLVGDGPDRQKLEEQIAAANLRQYFKFLGNLKREEVAELLQRMDVLVAPSVHTKEGRREGIPVVIMEGMAVGLAVVASRISGIPELVDDGQNGLLVPPRDAQALAQAIHRLAGDPGLRRKLGAAAREKVIQEFDVRSTAQRLGQQITARSSGG